MIEITSDNGLIFVRFDYNPSLVARLRSLPARSYNPTIKAWLIPAADAELLEKILPPPTPALLSELVSEQRRKADALKSLEMSPVAGIKNILPLYPFQQTAFRFLEIVKSGVVCLDVGCGKTLVAIELMASEQRRRVHLVLAPKTLLAQWRAELNRWWPEAEVLLVSGTSEQRRGALRKISAEKPTVVLANYELLLTGELTMPFGCIIADEATRISNTRTKTYKALLKLSSERRCALTGTPISNLPIDVFGIVSWTNPLVLGTFKSFIDRYAYFGMFGEIRGYKNLDELNARLRPYIFRRTLEECLPDLPEKTIIEVPFELSEGERKLYDKIRMGILHEIEPKLLSKVDIMTLSTTLVSLLRLQQVTDTMELVGKGTESSKLAVLHDLLTQIASSGQKAVLYTKFASMAVILHRELLQYQPATITGSVASAVRTTEIERFHQDPNCKVLIITDAAAFGLNLQHAASNIILYDLPYSAAKLAQIEGRVHRLGQKKQVRVYHLLAEHTVDMWVKKLLAKKLTLADKVLSRDVKDLLCGQL